VFMNLPFSSKGGDHHLHFYKLKGVRQLSFQNLKILTAGRIPNIVSNGQIVASDFFRCLMGDHSPSWIIF